jgi:oligopeptide/dipeptide ABC transporter ATP-binding protein
VSTTLLRADDVTVTYSRRVGLRQQVVNAVDRFTLEIAPGEVVGLVGESGCGKSTAGRALLGAAKLTSGRVTFRDKDISSLSGRQWRALRKDMQMVFQDPFSALDPRQTVREIIAEPLRVHGVAKGKDLNRRVDEMLDLVGLPRSMGNRYAHAFSGGQRQRIVLARALVLNPSFVVADEATSALDVSIQAQIVNLMQDLRSQLGLAYLFISHNLAVVRHVSDRVAIMYLGRIVEIGTRNDVFTDATHPYTQGLLASVPVPDPDAPRTERVVAGELPNALDPPSGCHFRTRCPKAVDRCGVERPPLTVRQDGHLVACWVQ